MRSLLTLVILPFVFLSLKVEVEGKLGLEDVNVNGLLEAVSSLKHFEQMDLQQLLTRISGVIQFGNQTIRLPEDLPRLASLFTSRSRTGRSFRDGGGGYGGGGWGEHSHGPGLISVANAFRLGCILFDFVEIKRSSENGLY
jgi:hypothetical protein